MALLAVSRFQVFGPQHLVILGVFALGCLAAVVLGRWLSPRGEVPFRRTTGVVILVLCGPFEVADWLHAVDDWRTSLPVQICDFAWLIATVALLTGSARWSALLYYWGLTLSLQGVLTPDLDHVFPDLQFFGFWVRHLAPVWAAVYLVGARAGPTWRSYRFVLSLTALWAAALMVLNALLDSNYGYLNAKPPTHSLLDVLGPWPWYVLIEAVLIVVGWALITWPWNRPAGPNGRAGHHDGRAPDPARVGGTGTSGGGVTHVCHRADRGQTRTFWNGHSRRMARCSHDPCAGIATRPGPDPVAALRRSWATCRNRHGGLLLLHPPTVPGRWHGDDSRLLRRSGLGLGPPSDRVLTFLPGGPRRTNRDCIRLNARAERHVRSFLADVERSGM